MTPSSNPFKALIDLFRSPVECYASLYQYPKWGWFAWVFIVLGPFMFWGYYFELVNQEWMITNIISQSPTLSPEELESWIQPEILLGGNIIGDMVGRTAVILFMSLWLTLATREQEKRLRWGQWLGISCFIFLPMIVGDIASYVSILFNYAQVMPNAADLNSLNGLLKLPMDHPWATFCQTIPLLMPWHIVLTYAALGAFTNYDRGHALSIALLPWIGVITLWPLAILFF